MNADSNLSSVPDEDRPPTRNRPRPDWRHWRARLRDLIRTITSSRRRSAAAAATAALALGIAVGYGIGAPQRSEMRDLESANVALAAEADELHEEIEVLNERISDLRGTVWDHRGDISDLKSEIREYEAAAAALEELETELGKREEDLDDREAAIIATENEIEANTIPGDGIWLVGDDIAPGVYQAQGSGSSCYWARLNSSDGFNVNANHFGSAKVSVEIRSSDWAFETSGCGSWTKRLARAASSALSCRCNQCRRQLSSPRSSWRTRRVTSVRRLHTTLIGR
jgi:hypothetical protein